MSRLGVGVIGASPGRGWALHAHLPALQALPDFHVAAVCTTQMQTALATARQFNVPAAYDDPAALAADPNVDVVAVTVKVPHHRELVLAALDAGKHVYCEWPLGHGLAEAEEMAARARTARTRGAIGLQGRSSPAVNQIRALIADGYVGRVLSTSLIVSGEHYCDEMPEELEVLLYPQFGTHLLTIHFGHLADTLCYCLGEFAELSASMATQRRDITIIESGRQVRGEAHDHIAISGTLQNGATASIHLRGGHSRANNMLWEINGTEGDLLITAEHGNLHIMPLTIRGGRGGDTNVSVIPPAPEYRWVSPDISDGPALHVAQAYARFAQDIAQNTMSCPGFDAALVRHRMLAAVDTAAATGKRQAYETEPEALST